MRGGLEKVTGNFCQIPVDTVTSEITFQYFLLPLCVEFLMFLVLGTTSTTVQKK